MYSSYIKIYYPYFRVTIDYNLSSEAQNEFKINDKNLSIDIMGSKEKKKLCISS